MIDTNKYIKRSSDRSFLLKIPIAFIVLILISMPILVRAERINVGGLSEPAENSELGLSTIGRVVKIHVNEGDLVKKGHLLLELDQELERLEAEKRKLIWQSKAEIDSVTKQAELLATQLKETKDLYQATGSIPREELESKELEYSFARAEQKRLEVNEKKEKNEYQTARQELGRRNLYAPFSGEVAEIMIGIGENCEPDVPLIRLVDSRRGVFVANVELPVSLQFSQGQRVRLHFENGEKTVLKDAKITFISPLIDPASGLRKVKAEFNNEDGAIVPGAAASMTLR